MKRKRSSTSFGGSVSLGVYPGILYTKTKRQKSSFVSSLPGRISQFIVALLAALVYPFLSVAKFIIGLFSRKDRLGKPGTVDFLYRPEKETVMMGAPSGKAAHKHVRKNRERVVSSLVKKLFYREKGLPKYVKALAVSLAACLVMVGLAGFIVSATVKNVVIYDGANTIEMRTATATVEELLEKSGIVLGEDDLLSVMPDAPVSDQMSIVIRRADMIRIVSGGETHLVSLAAGTVADALEKAGIELAEKDMVSPGLHTDLDEVDEIVHTMVTTEYLTSTAQIAFKSDEKEDSSLLKGKTRVEEGQQGEKSIKTKVVYYDGREVSREVVEERVVKEPVSQVTYIGTKEPPVVKVAAGKSGGSAKGGSSTGGGTAGGTGASAPEVGTINPNLVQFPGDTRTNQTPPSSDQIAKVFTATKITAYYDVRNVGLTASGNPIRWGSVAVNPSIIPYGTRMYIEGYGYAVAHDTGGFAKNNPYMIDVFAGTLSNCVMWGMRTNLKVYILK
ncbi:MAG: ubiquitin-like domain-containing protein [Christensenellales bacterium]